MYVLWGDRLWITPLPAVDLGYACPTLSAPPQSANQVIATQHEKYYFEDGNVIFQVSSQSLSGLVASNPRAKAGDKLFRVHKRVLVGSGSNAFASMFSLPQSQDSEGQTNEKPIVLNGDNAEQFEALMRILYPP
jgi:hypothetical protein